MNPQLLESSARAYMARRYYKDGFNKGFWFGFVSAAIAMVGLVVLAASIYGE